MRRRILLVLAAVAACEVSEPPTAPTVGPDLGEPSLTFTGGTGKVLSSTNAGELVEIDLDAGTASLVGAAGTFAGDSVVWTDIALDGSANLFGLSQSLFESDGQVHLYRIDPGTGAVLADVGPANGHRFSDFDWGGSTFYGNGGETSGGGDGQLFAMSESNAQVTWISSSFGLNPFDGTPIGRGGFAVHPATGDLWGIEALNSSAPVVFRVNPTTGVADSILRLGIGGVPAPQQIGFDGLHILDDSTFIATRGGFNHLDSALWEITVPDTVTGLAEIAHIPLVVDSAIAGDLNGLAPALGGGGGGGGALEVEVVCDDGAGADGGDRLYGDAQYA